MTPEEAKKYLKFYACDGSMKFVIGPTRTEALISAIEALEKQIPKKPHKTHNVYVNGHPYYTYVCDECGNVIDAYKNDFCPNCGQAIDWTLTTRSKDE